MIIGIDNRKIDLTDQEIEYYNSLVKEWGKEYFSDLFETDNKGYITIIKPIKDVPWVVLFFMQNVMINQQLRSNDERIRALEKK